MKKLIALLLFVVFVQPLLGQEKKDLTVFHRLLIFNSKQELMVVKIKNTDYWVTPGIYQNNSQLLKQGLDSLATTYGIRISPVVLKGVFMLKNDKNGSVSLRNVFITNKGEGILKMPDIIDEIRWLRVEEATRLITFPHINIMIQQITAYPKSVWGGSFLSYKEGTVFKVKVVEDFYQLYQ